MSSPRDATVHRLGERLRAAIRSEDYPEVAQLLAEFGEALVAAGASESTLREGMALLQQAKKAVLANRSHLRVKLSQLQGAARYHSAGVRSSTWLMQA